MPLSYATFTGNSGSPQNAFTIPYNYILKDHIKVYYGRDILANTQTSLLVSGTDYNFTSDTTIQLIGSTINSGTTTGNPHNLANGVVLTLERDTPDSSQIVEFADGSNLIGDNLNTANLQNLFVVQEQQDKNDLSAAKAIAAETASNTATANVANLTGSQFASNGSIPMSGDINANSNKIKNLADPTNAQDGVTKAYLERTGSITSTQIANGTIVNDDINTSANIAGTKINPSFGAQNISTTGTISSGNISATGTINCSSDITITSSAPRINFIDSGDDPDYFIINNGGGLGITDSTNNAVRLLINPDGHIDMPGNVDIGSVDVTGNLDVDGTTNLNSLTGDAVITSGTSTSDTQVYSAKRAEERFYGKDTLGEIQSGEIWSSTDDKVATTAAIDARVIDLVDDVGGFVPIANELSFPNANPDINNGAGTLVSIKALSTAYTSNGSGTFTISNGTVGNSIVTINGATASTTFAAGFGMILETTTTLNTYTFHRLVPKATEVTTIAGNTSNINTVAGISSNVTTVAGVASSVPTVANIASNVTTVAGVSSNVTTVAGISSNVTTVAGISSNVTTVANDGTDIGTVAGSINNVNTTAGSIANVNTVAGSISNVNTVSSNITNVINSSNYLNNFLQLYLGEASSDPTADGLGNPVTEGDLYFNTVDKRVRVFNGSVFQNLAESAVEVSKFATAAFNALYTASAGSNNIDLGGLAVSGAVFSNEAIAANRVSLGKGSGTFNLGGI